MPKVSAIIAAFNCKDYIRQTIESVLSQSFKDLELIVVDDFSTDGTGELLESFKDPRIKLITLDKNTGPSEARNTAIKAARGEFIAILDHDDAWLPEKIEKQLALFEKNQELGLVYCNCIMLKSEPAGSALDNSRTFFNSNKPERGLVFNKLLVCNFIPTSSVILRRKIIDDVGLFDKQYFIAQDFDYWLRITKKYRVDYLDEPLVRYRFASGVSYSRRDIALLEAIVVTKKHLRVKDVPLLVNLAARRQIMNCYKGLGLFYLKKQKFIDARKSFFSGIKTFPLDIKIFLGLLLSVLRKGK